MASRTPRVQEYVTAPLFVTARWIAPGLTHGIEPPFKLVLRLRNDVESHVRVLKAAEFSALASKPAGAIGCRPNRRRVARYEVAFPLKVGNPEAVDDVSRGDL